MSVKFKSYILLVALFLCSCSTPPNYKKEHQEFMSLANRAKSEMNSSAYKSWLNRKLLEKQSHLQAITSWQNREEKIHVQHEMMDSATSSTDAGPSVHDFKARNSAQQMHRYTEQKKFIERQIFYLNSQLSSLEGDN